MSSKLGRRRREELAAKVAGSFIPVGSKLPSTYYDSMAASSPHILEDIVRTAQQHRLRGGWLSSRGKVRWPPGRSQKQLVAAQRART